MKRRGYDRPRQGVAETGLDWQRIGVGKNRFGRAERKRAAQEEKSGATLGHSRERRRWRCSGVARESLACKETAMKWTDQKRPDLAMEGEVQKRMEATRQGYERKAPAVKQ